MTDFEQPCRLQASQRGALLDCRVAAKLQQAVIDDDNVFATPIDAVRVCSLGQISAALFEVGGQYRRSM